MKAIINRILPKSAISAIIKRGIFFDKKEDASWIKNLAFGHYYSADCVADEPTHYSQVFAKICRKMTIDFSNRWVYPFDAWHFREIPKGTSLICSITVDFGTVIESNLSQIQERLVAMKSSKFRDVELSIISSIFFLAKRISKDMTSLLNRKPRTLDEAIQKLLFYNGLFWQMNHMHVGIGRLDLILNPYYLADVKNDLLTYDSTKEMLYELCHILHRDIKAKSASMLGDTGQYILLGGIDSHGQTVDNDITKMFLELFAEHPLADPKLILRVNDETPSTTWHAAVKSIVAGSGSPLIMNERCVMDNMTKFGYSSEDVWNVGTSACLEPLIIGKSFDQNNPFGSLSALAAVNRAFLKEKDYLTFEEFMSAFETEMEQELSSFIVDNLHFDCSPLFTLFFDDCIGNEADFAYGGAKYAYHGAQVVGLPNAVNALLNIKELVFDRHIITQNHLRNALLHNFKGYEDVRSILIDSPKKFGLCDEDVISITNRVMEIASRLVASRKCNGRPLKVGFSSPNYIVSSENENASPDGRLSADPFGVHISPISGEIDICEIMDFSTKLNYSGNRINGNVVDFIVPSSYAQNPDKLVSLLQNAINKGTFEIQLNILDKETLIDAKRHPEKYPNLIVRVWGFSAYFNDLPESYKDNLIARAQIYN